ncbi:MAG: hypothetical protein JXQ75_03620 [Phycisphaerae bacterium]|nr:hypothetical protein [Phycisphaerae bacterium]
MLRKPDQLEPSLEEPFAQDKLSRSASITNLTRLVRTINQPFVISVNGRWGSGKTTFIKMWSQVLRAQGQSVLLFNAWENDFADDPLVALIGEIETQIVAGQPACKKAWAKFKKVGFSIAHHALPAAARIATCGVLDANTVKPLGGLGEAIKDGCSDVAAEVFQAKLAAYENDRKSLRRFRKALQDFTNSVTNEKESGKRIVFFIDELDRCRPDFAIRLLERVKHLFAIPGLVFVIAIDRVQLGESLKGVYGSGLDAEGYLRRFFDLDFRLSASVPFEFVHATVEAYEMGDFIPTVHGTRPVHDFIEYLVALNKLFAFSLRSQQQHLTELNILLRVLPKHYSEELVEVVAFLIALRMLDPALLDGFLTAQVAATDIEKRTRMLPGGGSFWDSHSLAQVAIGELYAISRNGSDWKEHFRIEEAASGPAADDDRRRRAQTRVHMMKRVAQRLSPERLLGDLRDYLEFAVAFQ